MGSAAPRTWSTSLRCAKQLEHCTSKHHASQRAAGMPAALFVCLMHVAFSHINALSPRRSPTPTSRVTLLRLSHAPRPRSSLPCPPRHAPAAALPRPISPCLVPGMKFEARVGSFFGKRRVDPPSRPALPGNKTAGNSSRKRVATREIRKNLPTRALNFSAPSLPASVSPHNQAEPSRHQSVSTSARSSRSFCSRRSVFGAHTRPCFPSRKLATC